MKLAYVRVSTVEQNEARQVEALKPQGIDKWYVEKVSGKNVDRPELQRMLSEAKPGDTVCVHDFSRLARSTKDLLGIVEGLNKRGVHVVSDKERIDTSTPSGKLMLTMMAAIYEFERTNMLERQAEGIAIAKTRGIYKGGKAKNVDQGLFGELMGRYEGGMITKSAFARELGVSRPTLDRLLKTA